MDDAADATTDAADAAASCRTDEECSDRVFCNGQERCDPGSDTADTRGCVGGPPPCPGGECDESGRRCDGDCADGDGDGYADAACGGTDCDDANPAINPGAQEVCDPDHVDEDCDPSTFAGPEGDLDEDGFVSDRCCNSQPDGRLRCGTDCDDNDLSINPAAADICDGIDNDCDGRIDENPNERYYRDRDGDGFGVTDDWILACSAPPGFSVLPGDCDDTNRDINPSSPELCDGVDNNCDGNIDEGCPCVLADGSTAVTGFERPCDTERAGVGNCRAGVQTCTASGWSTCAGSIRPGSELCNTLMEDEDCDGMVDESCECLITTTRPCSTNVGRCVAVTQECIAPGVWPRSCEEQSGVVFPRAEMCNGMDDDCNGIVDDGCGCSPPGSSRSCSTNTGVCTVGSQTCTSGAWGACSGVTATTEACNHVDDDCDSFVDEYVGQPTCTFDRAGSAARGSFHGCEPSCPGTPTTHIARLANTSDSIVRGIYLNARDNRVDWGGAVFRASAWHRVVRTATTSAPVGAISTVITPTRALGTAASRGLPTTTGDLRGYAATLILNPFDYRVRIYRLTSSGPTMVAQSSTILPFGCWPSGGAGGGNGTTANVTVTLQATGGALTAWASVEGMPNCAYEEVSATYTDPGWLEVLYRQTTSFPRYDVGTIVVSDDTNGNIDLERMRVVRQAPISFGSVRPAFGHCVACPW